MEPQVTDIRIRKVSILGKRIREQAYSIGAKDNDLVILRTFDTSPVTYKVEKIEGDPVSYLMRSMAEPGKDRLSSAVEEIISYLMDSGSYEETFDTGTDVRLHVEILEVD